ncbi:hypothetical protein ACFYM0_02915 [Streptomyces sp. NPDC006487]|uniref:hypothetical protein n=1 Tax=Streptomyces sp. NPDC006487 TaxID=3364748 RepID=UPI0036BBEACE
MRPVARAMVLSAALAALMGTPLAAWAAEGPPAAAPAAAAAAAPAEAGKLPGLGPQTRSLIPDRTRQVLLVSGSADSAQSTVSLYQRGPSGWQRTAGPWTAHNGLRGWTHAHELNDLRSPYGVYGLTDAGGWLPDPGTKLPYRGNADFKTDRVFAGKPMTDSFGYVIAINYNRVQGRSPMDNAKPLGTAKGGGIWLHVDADAPTQGCVSISRGAMRRVLRTLNPAAHPVIVMGDRTSLAA